MKRGYGFILLLIGLGAFAGPIVSDIAGNPAVVISRSTAFASAHVAQGTTLHLSKDGGDYIGIGRSTWEWTVDQAGNRVSDNGSNFRLRPPVVFGDSAVFSVTDPSRGFPDEAITPVAVAKVGDTLVINSRARGSAVTAKVTSIDTGGSIVHTDYVAIDGDSDSNVSTTSGTFVGFVSTKTGIVTPNLGPLVGTTPAPKPPQPVPTPAPVPTQEQLDKAVADAKTSERANVVSQLQGLVDKLRSEK